MLAIVAVVDLARKAALGAQSRDHRRALQDRVGRSAEVLLKGDGDGNGVDGMDTHGALVWFASGNIRSTVASAGEIRGIFDPRALRAGIHPCTQARRSLLVGARADLEPWASHHRCGRMLVVGYTIDDLSVEMPNGDVTIVVAASGR